MVRISISAEAFDAIAAALPRSVRSEPAVNPQGDHLLWIDKGTLDRLQAQRGPGESYSDVILRLAAVER